MPTPKELQTNADECLRLARESIEICTKLALIEMGTEFDSLGSESFIRANNTIDGMALKQLRTGIP
jgi:hypothetical protein